MIPVPTSRVIGTALLTKDRELRESGIDGRRATGDRGRDRRRTIDNRDETDDRRPVTDDDGGPMTRTTDDRRPTTAETRNYRSVLIGSHISLRSASLVVRRPRSSSPVSRRPPSPVVSKVLYQIIPV